jgi:hypothetical protein
MSLFTLIRTNVPKSVPERIGVPVPHRSRLGLPQKWPAVGLLLIAPGIFSIDALAPHTGLAHAAGLNLDIGYVPTVHLHTPTTLTLSTMSVFGTKGQFSIRLGKKLLDNFTIAEITPKPLSARIDGNQYIYFFSGGGKDAVQFSLVPKVVGRTAATIQYGLDPPVPFSITTVP